MAGERKFVACNLNEYRGDDKLKFVGPAAATLQVFGRAAQPSLGHRI
jgi:hypothetical protein